MSKDEPVAEMPMELRVDAEIVNITVLLEVHCGMREPTAREIRAFLLGKWVAGKDWSEVQK